MKNIEIKIFKETRMVELNKFIIGNDGENLQGNLVFTFDEFVDGQARLEYVIDGEKNYIVLEKVDETYQVPILSVITKKGQIDMQVVVTQGTEDVAIFKSNLFYLTCNASINAEIEQPDEYLQWIEVANAKLNEVDNLDIDAVKENGVATITITKKDGTQQSVNLFDAEGAVTNYELLENLPSINGVELTGDKSLDELNIQEKGDYLTSENDPLFKQSASASITSQDITNWNNKSDFNGSYNNLTDKPVIPTKTSDLTNDSSFASESYVTNAIANAQLGGDTGEIDLSGYATKDELNTKVDKVSGKSLIADSEIERLSSVTNYDDTEIKNILKSKADTSAIPTKVSQLSNDNGYLTEVPSEYITETELSSKGFLTSVPSEYVTETELNAKGYLSSIPTEYVTESELNDAISGLGGGTGNVSSDIINSIMVVDELPEVEIEGVLYLVKESEIIEPELINLYPSQIEQTEEDGFTITFKEQNVIVNGSNSSTSLWGWTNKFTMNLEANKTYYLQLTNISGSFDDSERINNSDGIVTTVSLTGTDSSGKDTNLINQIERSANGVYEKYTFTPSTAYSTYYLSLQVKKYNVFDNWNCSIVIAEEK